MRTTLDLEESLVKEALNVTHIKTKTELITYALSELIQREKARGLKSFKGKFNLDIDLDVLRKR